MTTTLQRYFGRRFLSTLMAVLLGVDDLGRWRCDLPPGSHGALA